MKLHRGWAGSLLAVGSLAVLAVVVLVVLAPDERPSVGARRAAPTAQAPHAPEARRTGELGAVDPGTEDSGTSARRAAVAEPARDAGDGSAPEEPASGVLVVAARVYGGEGLWLPLDAPGLRIRVEATTGGGRPAAVLPSTVLHGTAPAAKASSKTASTDEASRDATSTDTESSNTESFDTESSNTASTDTASTDTESTNTASTNAALSNTASSKTEASNTASTNTASTNTASTNTASTSTASTGTASTSTASIHTASPDMASTDTASIHTGLPKAVPPVTLRPGELVALPAGRYTLTVVEDSLPAGLAPGFDLRRPEGDHIVARWMDRIEDPRGRLLETVEVVAGEAREGLVYLWPLVEVHGRTLVRDADGERGIGVCHVEFAPDPIYSGRAIAVDTDPEGSYVARLRPGVYRARLGWGPKDGSGRGQPWLGYYPVAPPPRWVDLRSVEALRLDLAYEPLCSVEGELLHAWDHTALAGAEVELALIHRDREGRPIWREDGAPSWQRVAFARTDAQGRYRFEHVTPGLYRVTPRSDGDAPPVWHNVESLRGQGDLLHEIVPGPNDVGVFHALPGGPAEVELILPEDLRGRTLRCDVIRLPWAPKRITAEAPLGSPIEYEPWGAPERIRFGLWPPNPPLRIELYLDGELARTVLLEAESVWVPGRVVVL